MNKETHSIINNNLIFGEASREQCSHIHNNTKIIKTKTNLRLQNNNYL